jgi:hypothetical protein
MNDPHVERLHYTLRTAEHVSFNYTPPVDRDTPSYRIRLEGGKLTAEMKDHHATTESAVRAVDPFLRAWVIDTSLRLGKDSIWFEFAKADIIDRNPPPPDVVRYVTAVAVSHSTSVLIARGKVVHGSYPSPPPRFKATPDVETMWFRYQVFLDGKEPLLSMAYAVLTLLEGSTGAKKDVHQALCDTYKIDRDVRKKLGDIVSQRGDAMEARKLGGTASKTPLTTPEKTWVEEVIKALIRRKAEYDAEPSAPLTPIRMADFGPFP